LLEQPLSVPLQNQPDCRLHIIMGAIHYIDVVASMSGFIASLKNNFAFRSPAITGASGQSVLPFT